MSGNILSKSVANVNPQDLRFLQSSTVETEIRLVGGYVNSWFRLAYLMTSPSPHLAKTLS